MQAFTATSDDCSSGESRAKSQEPSKKRAQSLDCAIVNAVPGWLRGWTQRCDKDIYSKAEGNTRGGTANYDSGPARSQTTCS